MSSFPSGWNVNYDVCTITGHIVKDMPWREQSNRQNDLGQPDVSGAFELGCLYVDGYHLIILGMHGFAATERATCSLLGGKRAIWNQL